MKEYKTHPLAELFPIISADEMSAMVKDIKTRGLQNPITLFEGKILDGRHRYEACGIANVNPKYVLYSGKDPTGFVLSANLHRRHLDTGQRAAVAARLVTSKVGGQAKTKTENDSANLPIHQKTKTENDSANLPIHQKTKTENDSANLPIHQKTKTENDSANLPIHQKTKTENDSANLPIHHSEAADLLNVSTRTVTSAVRLKEQSPKLFARLSAGEITLHAAEKMLDEKRTKSEPVVDETGFSIPEELHALWSHRCEVSDILADVTRIQNRILKGQKESDLLFLGLNFSAVVHLFQQAEVAIRALELHAVCGTCQGRGRSKCALCRGRGFNSKIIWKTCIPEEAKAMRAKAVKK